MLSNPYLLPPILQAIVPMEDSKTPWINSLFLNPSPFLFIHVGLILLRRFFGLPLILILLMVLLKEFLCMLVVGVFLETIVVFFFAAYVGIHNFLFVVILTLEVLKYQKSHQKKGLNSVLTKDINIFPNKSFHRITSGIKR